jgi:hypothetical protein
MGLASSSVGLGVWGKGSTAAATACTISSNQENNVQVTEGATATLNNCQSNGSKNCGWLVTGEDSCLVASSSTAVSNAGGNAVMHGGGKIVCLSNCDLGGKDVVNK